MKHRIAANDVSFRQELYGPSKKGQQQYTLPLSYALTEGLHTASIPGQPGMRVSAIDSPGDSGMLYGAGGGCGATRLDFAATGMLEDHSTYITDALAKARGAEVPASRIPAELHMYEGSVVAQLGDPDTEARVPSVY
jgi:hypothetical protein